MPTLGQRITARRRPRRACSVAHLRVRPAAAAGRLRAGAGALALLALAAGGPAHAQTYKISDGPGGGDCHLIGAWDGTARACTVNRDIVGTVILADDRLVLDGAGHTVRVPRGQSTAIAAEGAEALAIRDVRVEDFWVGVWLAGGSGHRIERLRAARPRPGPGPFLDTPCAICIWDATDCRVEAADIAGPVYGVRLERTRQCAVVRSRLADVQVGVKAQNAAATLIDENSIRAQVVAVRLRAGGPAVVSRNAIERAGAGIGISVDGSDGNRIFFNTITGAAMTTLDHWVGRGSEIFCNDIRGPFSGATYTLPAAALTWWNNFLDGAEATDLGGNFFDRPRPVGGNYWAWDAPACQDPDGDGFCNAPRAVGLSFDNLPRVRPVPWRQHPEICLGGGGQQGPPVTP